MAPARGGAVDTLRAVAVPVLVGRALVLGALALARYLADHTHPAASVVLRVHEGLLGWDAGWYRDIAAGGYASLPREGLRFFPALPLVTRALHGVTGLSYGACLIGVVNVAAVVASALLYRLVVVEGGRPELARRAVWVLALAPSAFVLVMGYAESVLLVLSLGAFLGLRRQRWWLAAGCGFLAGLTRPIGFLLIVPALVEATREWRARTPIHLAGWVGRTAAVLAPAAGCATFLGWVASRFGDFWLPVRIQESGQLRGRFADPVTTAVHDARDLFHAHIGTGLHVPWLVVIVVLLFVAFRRWPASYGLYAAAVVGLAVSSSNFDSLERYGLSAFPLVIAAATLLTSEAVERAVWSILGGLLVSYSLLAFMNALVP